MPVWPSRGFWSSLNFRGFLWIAVGTVFILSFLLYSTESTAAGAQAGPMDWLFRSWPQTGGNGARLPANLGLQPGRERLVRCWRLPGLPTCWRTTFLG